MEHAEDRTPSPAWGWHLLASITIFGCAFAVRWEFLGGPILGDDAQVWALLNMVLRNGLDLHDQLHVRFGTWLPNYLSYVLFGISEITFMLPTVLFSAALGVVAYWLLVSWGYALVASFLGGLFVATAPFEVVIGTLHANDLYLAVPLALALLALVRLESRPALQGATIAFCLWYGFYVKLWVVYVLPALALYYLLSAPGRPRWRGPLAFVAASAILHGLTAFVWWIQLGTVAPFIDSHAANFAVPREQLAWVWSLYPKMLLQGSEFGTTLFGWVPYLLAALVLVKLVATLFVARTSPLRFDRVDVQLLVLWSSLFLLVNFFPNGFTLDAYYSVPRIFRYLTLVSFPMALHVAKLLLDVGRTATGTKLAPALTIALLAGGIVLNVQQADEATGPGRVYRRTIRAVAAGVRRAMPPKLVAEASVAARLQDVYLDPDVTADVILIPNTYTPEQYEAWLTSHQDALPAGTLLLTGLVGFVHYAAHQQGFRLRYFARPLDPRWELLGEYGELSYVPEPEPVRLWRLARGGSGEPRFPREDVSALRGAADYEALMQDGLKHLQEPDYDGARVRFRKIIDDRAPNADDARFFYATAFFRERAWLRSRREFAQLYASNLRGKWAAASLWHVAQCELRLGRRERGRTRLAWIVAHPSLDRQTSEFASGELRVADLRREGLIGRLWDRWFR